MTPSTATGAGTAPFLWRRLSWCALIKEEKEKNISVLGINVLKHSSDYDAVMQ